MDGKGRGEEEDEVGPAPSPALPDLGKDSGPRGSPPAFLEAREDLRLASRGTEPSFL